MNTPSFSRSNSTLPTSPRRTRTTSTKARASVAARALAWSSFALVAAACSSAPISGENTSQNAEGLSIACPECENTTQVQQVNLPCGVQGGPCCAGDAYHQCNAQTSPVQAGSPAQCRCGGVCGEYGELACSSTNSQTDREVCNPGLMPAFNKATKEGGSCISCDDYTATVQVTGVTQSQVFFWAQVWPAIPFELTLTDTTNNKVVGSWGGLQWDAYSTAGTETSFWNLTPGRTYEFTFHPGPQGGSCPSLSNHFTTTLPTGGGGGGGGMTGGTCAMQDCVANCGTGCQDIGSFCSLFDAERAAQGCLVCCGGKTECTGQYFSTCYEGEKKGTLKP